jgi:D-lyxose ketol-isomerase
VFNLRNGKYNSSIYTKKYAQKAMYMKENQKSVIHYHKDKMEDIFNQGGGNILIEFWKVDDNGELSNEPVDISLSGKHIVQPAGEPVCIVPGESVWVPQYTYHRFWAQKDHGSVLSVEVSTVCNDYGDNFFLESGERFPSIQEDEPARYLLCNEYNKVQNNH